MRSRMQEAVELRLGQRIGAVVLERVLRRDHEERLAAARCVTPSTRHRPSLIASSSADWVRGLARLISSASTTFAKSGPGWNTKRPVARPSSSSGTAAPISRAGSRSLVNWMRRKLAVDASARARARASSCRRRARPRSAGGRRRPAPRPRGAPPRACRAARARRSRAGARRRGGFAHREPG